jgi:hypothetical protein
MPGPIFVKIIWRLFEISRPYLTTSVTINYSEGNHTWEQISQQLVPQRAYRYILRYVGIVFFSINILLIGYISRGFNAETSNFKANIKPTNLILHVYTIFAIIQLPYFIKSESYLVIPPTCICLPNI